MTGYDSTFLITAVRHDGFACVGTASDLAVLLDTIRRDKTSSCLV